MDNYSRAHEVKIKDCYFENVMSGRKRFEIREDDRDYQVGDWLKLECGSRAMMVEIIYKSTYMQKEGYCVLGLNHPKHEGYKQK